MKEAGCYGAIDLTDGTATLFIPRLPAEHAVWMGPIETPASYAARYLVVRMGKQPRLRGADGV